MKHRTIMLAILAPLSFVLAASAQEPVPGAPLPNETQGMAVESVIVTAPRDRPEKQLDNFIIAHAAPSPYLRKIARWKAGICPLTIGMSAKLNMYVTQRIVRVAMMSGAPLDSREPCRPNLLVLATPQPQELLDAMRTKHPVLLGYHYRSQAEHVAIMSRPIQAWYSTATEDFWGFVRQDGSGLNWNTPEFGGLADMTPLHVSGARTGDGLKSQFTTAIIMVDSSKIAGQPIGPLADYIAMLALAQGQYYDVCQPVPTITNLLAPNCTDVMKPMALTDIDATYLHGLYKMSPGGSYLGERSSIAYAMKKDLGGY
jgi:hypothetical protein